MRSGSFGGRASAAVGARAPVWSNSLPHSHCYRSQHREQHALNERKTAAMAAASDDAPSYKDQLLKNADTAAEAAANKAPPCLAPTMDEGSPPMTIPGGGRGGAQGARAPAAGSTCMHACVHAHACARLVRAGMQRMLMMHACMRVRAGTAAAESAPGADDAAAAGDAAAEFQEAPAGRSRSWSPSGSTQSPVDARHRFQHSGSGRLATRTSVSPRTSSELPGAVPCAPQVRRNVAAQLQHMHAAQPACHACMHAHAWRLF